MIDLQLCNISLFNKYSLGAGIVQYGCSKPFCLSPLVDFQTIYANFDLSLANRVSIQLGNFTKEYSLVKPQEHFPFTQNSHVFALNIKAIGAGTELFGHLMTQWKYHGVTGDRQGDDK